MIPVGGHDTKGRVRPICLEKSVDQLVLLLTGMMLPVRTEVAPVLRPNVLGGVVQERRCMPIRQALQETLAVSGTTGLGEVFPQTLDGRVFLPPQERAQTDPVAVTCTRSRPVQKVIDEGLPLTPRLQHLCRGVSDCVMGFSGLNQAEDAVQSGGFPDAAQSYQSSLPNRSFRFVKVGVIVSVAVLMNGGPFRPEEPPAASQMIAPIKSLQDRREFGTEGCMLGLQETPHSPDAISERNRSTLRR